MVIKCTRKVLIMVILLQFDIMRRIEIDNVEAMLEKTVSEDGKIWGLKEWANKKAIIIIPKE